MNYGENGLETPLSLLLSLLDLYHLSQLGLVIFHLFRLDLVILDLFRLDLAIFDLFHLDLVILDLFRLDLVIFDLPSGSGYFRYIPSGLITPVPTGPGNPERLQPRQKQLQHLLLTIEELEQMEDALLNFERMFRSIPFTAETTREEKIRLILQYQSPSVPITSNSNARNI